jgi:hypothetical protein
VYGAGDLAIAHTLANEDPEQVTARAICWPERKVFGRVYPTIDEEGHAETLRTALHALGYRSTYECEGEGLDGARMLRIEEDDGVVMPYLDSPYQYFDCNGGYLTLRRSGEFEGTGTNGIAPLTPEYRYTCGNCEDGYNEGRYTVYERCAADGGREEQDWCESCANYSTFTCAGFGETFSNNVASAEWKGHTYTQAWLDDNTFISDFSGDRISNDDVVTMHNGDVWSNDEFDRYGQELDRENWPTDDAEDEMERRAAAADEAQMGLMTL